MHQGLMIRHDGECSPIVVLVELFHTKNDGQRLLVQLRVMLFNSGQVSRGKCNGSLGAIRYQIVYTAPTPYGDALHAKISGLLTSKWTST